jgi:arsenite methyltransferase
MAHLEGAECCSAAAQADCCAAEDKDGCCGDGGCGCSAPRGRAGQVRSRVRERYGAVAADIRDTSCLGEVALTDRNGNAVFGASLYADAGEDAAAVGASLGCGVPTAVAELRAGETVLDLGSGAGADVLISARRVGSSGKAIGLDMTDEMLELARRNAAEAGLDNVEFVKGFIEAIPLPDASVDVIISNCVLNLSVDKPRVIREAARVLRPGGRFAISDVLADPDMDDATCEDMQQWTGCIAGALTRGQFEQALSDAGLIDVEIIETHRVHERAGAAIVRARKPHALGAAAPAIGESCSLDAAALLSSL